MLGRGREGVQAGEIREHARLRQRSAVRGAALLRPVGPRDVSQARAALAIVPSPLVGGATSSSPHMKMGEGSAHPDALTPHPFLFLPDCCGCPLPQGERAHQQAFNAPTARVYRAPAAALAIDSAVWPNKIARSSA